MLTHRRRTLVTFVLTLILASILLGLTLPSPARADVGVHPVLPGGSSIEPEEPTPIQMAAEVVTMDVRLATAGDNAIIELNPAAYGLQFQPIWYPLVAEVQADFSMYNPTAGDVSLTTWFPLASSLGSVSWELNFDEIVPRIASFKVQVDGTPLDYTTIELPNPQGADRPALPWASFPVTFPAGKNTSIKVSYLLPLTQAVKGSELALYYIFQTGAGWDGSIGRAELILNLPYPASSDTLVRVDPTHLSLPYPMAEPRHEIDFGGVFDRNQARFTWTDFEPTAQDDFSVWLIDPEVWQGLEEARASISGDPEDGQAWLTLASKCRNVAVKAYNFPSIFYNSYLSQCIDAYGDAERLLPDHPAPHIGLASLTLANNMRNTNAAPSVIHEIQDELEIAKGLEQAHPEWANEGDLTISMVEDGLSIYFGNVTATAEIYATGTSASQQTLAAALTTPSMTPSPQPSLTPTVMPSVSPIPATPTSTADAPLETAVPSDGGQVVIFLVVAMVTILAIAGFLILGRLRGKIT